LNLRLANIKYKVVRLFDFIYLNLRLININYKVARFFDFIFKKGNVYKNSVLTKVNINVVITKKFFVFL